LYQYGGLGWGDIWLWNLIPVTLGNIIGGMVFIGFVYYLAFRNEIPADSPASGAPAGKAVSK
ncbi:MAG: formate/nitrite transporter family protein, partial [Clostridia bacterium]|nr:formate/nitrite transporter family protein [Clostridia bacterium]